VGSRRRGLHYPANSRYRLARCYNLIEIVPGTSPASLATVERDSWRHEWWCAQPEPYYDKEATIKCNNQRREWCAYHPADLSEYDQGVIVRNDSRREWCARHPADP